MTLQDKFNALGIPCDILGDVSTYFGRKIYLSPKGTTTVNKIHSRLKDLQLYFGVASLSLSQEGASLVLSYDTEREPLNFIETNGNLKQSFNSMRLPINGGCDENGSPYIFDLAQAPHLLIAGTTGSGKSVFIHDIILSLIQDNKASLTLIDPKQVEFSVYDFLKNKRLDFEHIITSTGEAVEGLRIMCEIMDSRYKKMSAERCREFSEYRALHPKEVYHVIIIDELADLILTAPKSIEKYICRIAQLGRACGIHLVVATQRPSADIITGLIRANFPSRCAFMVATSTDSRIILDSTGAEKLRGAGSYIMKLNGKPATEYQAPFISTKQLTDYAEEQSKI